MMCALFVTCSACAKQLFTTFVYKGNQFITKDTNTKNMRRRFIMRYIYVDTYCQTEPNQCPMFQ